jgi:hypothetical protein
VPARIPPAALRVVPTDAVVAERDRERHSDPQLLDAGAEATVRAGDQASEDPGLGDGKRRGFARWLW